MPARAMGWFGTLHPGIRILLAGAVLLVLAVLLSPVMRVVAIVAFLASAAFLILNGVQRRFAPRWAVAAASSLVLVFVFGGISGAVYGNGFLGSGASDGSGGAASGYSASEDRHADVPQLDPSDPDAIYGMRPVLSGTPDFEVTDVRLGVDGAVALTVNAAITGETCLDGIRLLMEDVGAQTERFDRVEIDVWNLYPIDGLSEGAILFGFAGFDDNSGSGSMWGEDESGFSSRYKEGKYEYDLDNQECYGA